ncbi:MAG TPA: hypothetical protein VEO95_00745, partial [Chthoniobacteraceae bacterium]|nr:hypothetical protein [Chthoniobacteraceae bacterium]
MDEYHNVPVWLPNWALDQQLEFFIQRPVDVLAVKEYAVAAPHQARIAVVLHKAVVASAAKHHRPIAITPRVKKHRSVFLSTTRSHSARSAKPPVAKAGADPLTATSLTGRPAGSGDRGSDSGNSADKANEVRQQLLNRNQSVKLRPE